MYSIPPLVTGTRRLCRGRDKFFTRLEDLHIESGHPAAGWGIYGDQNRYKLYEEFSGRELGNLTGCKTLPELVEKWDRPRVLDLMGPASSFLIPLSKHKNIIGHSVTLSPSPIARSRGLPENILEFNGSLALGSTWSKLGEYEVITLRPLAGIEDTAEGVYLLVKTFIRALNHLAIGGNLLIDLRYCRFVLPILHDYLDNHYSEDFRISDIRHQTDKLASRSSLQLFIERTNSKKVLLKHSLLQNIAVKASQNLYMLGWYYQYSQSSPTLNSLSVQITDPGWEFLHSEAYDFDGDYFVNTRRSKDEDDEMFPPAEFDDVTGDTDLLLFRPFLPMINPSEA